MGLVNTVDSILWTKGTPPSTTMVWLKDDGLLYIWNGVDWVPAINAGGGSIGATGPMGPQGPQGIQGIPGINGTNGTNGVDGNTGLQGIQGIEGPRGFTGAQGPQGLQGIQGIQGMQGIRGLTGEKGDTGKGLVINGSVQTEDELPSIDNVLGWIIHVQENNHVYVWDGLTWFDMGLWSYSEVWIEG